MQKLARICSGYRKECRLVAKVGNECRQCIQTDLKRDLTIMGLMKPAGFFEKCWKMKNEGKWFENFYFDSQPCMERKGKGVEGRGNTMLYNEKSKNI
jgi:hypothetical protein